MHTVVYFYIFIIVLCWTLNPFIKKVLLTNVGKSEYLVINHVFITLFVLIYFLFMFSRNKCDINCIRNLSKREIGLLTLGAISSLLGTLMLIHLISYSDVSYAIAHIQPIVISLTLIIGYLVFNEALDTYKVIGISLVVLGLIILNKH